jgi:hypothetical protein
LSLLELATVVIALAVVVIAYQLIIIRALVGRAALSLRSLDEELFHVAQEQNPHYGICSDCGRKTIVSHVVPKDKPVDPNALDLFYCQSCWWLSSDVIAGDEKKYYKNRMTEQDINAAHAGPG